MTLVAIDFGTSNTVVSYLEPDTQKPKTLRFEGISRVFRLNIKDGVGRDIPVIPTWVYVAQKNQLIVGQAVRNQNLGGQYPERLFKGFKRDLVADFQAPPRRIDGEMYDGARIAQAFIEAIWQELPKIGVQPTQVVFSVPVGSFERYLDWFRTAIQPSLGLQAAQLSWIDESTAAALGYALRRVGALVLVIDFGGGTLDLSLVRTTQESQPGVRQAAVIAKADAYVGGEDIDRWIAEDCLRREGIDFETIEAVAWQNLLAVAESLKVSLSGAQVAKETWLDEGTMRAYELSLTRDRLEIILEQQQVLEQLREACDEIVATALRQGIAKAEIERVLLVGGSCLLSAIQQVAIAYFGKDRVRLGKPFEAVSHGALALNWVAEVADYLHHSYVIRLWNPYEQNYTYYTLFEQGCAYPCQRAENLVLQVATDGQTEIRLDIGELAAIKQAEVSFDESGRMMGSQLRSQEQYRSLDGDREAVCVAHLDPPGQAGVDRIEVGFEVDAQRCLRATVRDLLGDRLLLEHQAIAQLQ